MAGILPQIVFDSKPLSNFLTNFEVAMPVANIKALSRMRAAIPGVVRAGFIAAMDATYFPPVYRGHLLACTRNIPIAYINAGDYIEVFVDIEALGDASDLARGYHREALEKSLGDTHSGPKPRVHLPYEGQVLYNQDNPEARASFWEAIANKVPYDVGKESSKSAQLQVDTSDMFDATLINRVSVWADKAPEWLILQWGSHNGGSGEPPQTKPQPLVEDLRELVGVTCSSIYVTAVAEAIASIPREAGAGQFSMNGQVFDKINGAARNAVGQFSKTF